METQSMATIGPVEIASISAAVTVTVQLLKLMIAPKYAPLACVLASALAVALFAFSRGYQFSTDQLFSYFAAWGTVSLSATGIFGLSKATGEGLKNALGPKLDE